MIKLLKIIFITAISSCNVVSAATFSAANFADHGTYTSGHVSGLDWLDLSANSGRSYNDAFSKVGSGLEFDGWTFATGAKSVGFFNNMKVILVITEFTATSIKAFLRDESPLFKSMYHDADRNQSQNARGGGQEGSNTRAVARLLTPPPIKNPSLVTVGTIEYLMHYGTRQPQSPR